MAQALTYLSQPFGGLFTLVVGGDDAARAVAKHIDVHLDVVDEWNLIDLAHESIIRSFNVEPCEPLDPQMTLPMKAAMKLYSRLLVGGGWASLSGFVGFAVNLIRLTDNQLAWSMNLPADLAASLAQPSAGASNAKKVGRLKRGAAEAEASTLSLGLRQTLFSHLFGDTMVFETNGDVESFLERCRSELGMKDIKTRLISLEGRCYGKGTLTGFPVLDSLDNTTRLGFSAVPVHDQLDLALDLTVGVRVKASNTAAMKKATLLQLKSKGESMAKEVVEAEEKLEEKQGELSSAEEALSRDKPSLEARISDVKGELESLRFAAR